VVPQFWLDPESSQREVQDGWVHVGDGFTTDDEGFFWYHKA
jgi:acyl-coenzyme A synthetase/AMP-(fatty) acid ligase